MRLQPLSSAPLLGHSLSGVSLLRLDQTGGVAPGNKRYKLQPWLERAARENRRTLLSFGGAWSNHLHALAAAGHEAGIATVGVVRGDLPSPLTATLADARRWGMRLIGVSRAEYRRRNEAAYQALWCQRYPGALLIPEGGADSAAVEGSRAIVASLAEAGDALVVVPVGTGTTLAGIALGLGPDREVLGIAALKGAVDLEQRVRTALAAFPDRAARWRIEHQFHCGGFAKSTPALRQFVSAFEVLHGIPLDPVYTAKAVYAVFQLRAGGALPLERPVVIVHTGGLQGRRGVAWLPDYFGNSSAI